MVEEISKEIEARTKEIEARTKEIEAGTKEIEAEIDLLNCEKQQIVERIDRSDTLMKEFQAGRLKVQVQLARIQAEKSAPPSGEMALCDPMRGSQPQKHTPAPPVLVPGDQGAPGATPSAKPTTPSAKGSSR